MITKTKSPKKDKIDKNIVALIILQYQKIVKVVAGDNCLPYQDWQR